VSCLRAQRDDAVVDLEAAGTVAAALETGQV
jgi:hypothetical protein